MKKSDAVDFRTSYLKAAGRIINAFSNHRRIYGRMACLGLPNHVFLFNSYISDELREEISQCKKNEAIALGFDVLALMGFSALSPMRVAFEPLVGEFAVGIQETLITRGFKYEECVAFDSSLIGEMSSIPNDGSFEIFARLPGFISSVKKAYFKEIANIALHQAEQVDKEFGFSFSVLCRTENVDHLKAAASHVLAAMLTDGYDADYNVEAVAPDVKLKALDKNVFRVNFVCK